jgi:MFS family permease
MDGVTDRPPTPGPTSALEQPRDPKRPFTTSPFSRLARTHALGVAGDALFAIALAGSVFFSLDFDSARWRVALYLVLTIAPFAVAAPLIGPALDRIRGGRRWVIVGSLAMRALLCVLVIRHLDSLLFYPEAFLMLVLGKAYTISKSAIVPTTVRSDTELVEANSKLTVLSAVAVVIAVVPGGILLKFGGSEWTLGLAVGVFAAATLFALQLPSTTVAQEPAGEIERMELRSAAIFLASIAMGSIRLIVGFLIFMLAFDFKNTDAPGWYLGVTAAGAQLGFFMGAVAAPRLRRIAEEERILVGNLVVTAIGGLLCAGLGGLPAAALLSMIVGATSSASKQAFDAIIQRDAPDANRGRSFARFETRFQLFWVVGALLPIIIPIPAELGFLLVGLTAAGSVGWYLWGLWRVRHGHVPARRRGVPSALRRFRGTSTDQGDDPTDPPPPPPPPPSPPLAPQPPPAATPSGRRWSGGAPGQPAGAGWQPPAGFVSQRLVDGGGDDAPTLPFGSAPGGPGVAPSDAGSVVQPQLPLGDELDYPDPPWRDDTNVPEIGGPETGGQEAGVPDKVVPPRAAPEADGDPTTVDEARAGD